MKFKAEKNSSGESVELKATPNLSGAQCRWCAEGQLPAMVLDDDGTKVSITGRAGTLSHAYEDAWWPCLRFGVELHSVANGQDTKDSSPLRDELERHSVES